MGTPKRRPDIRPPFLVLTHPIIGTPRHLRRRGGPWGFIGRAGREVLLNHVDQGGVELLGDRDYLGVRLIALLGNNHVDELIGQVHVRALQLTRCNAAELACRRAGKPD